LGLPNFIPAKDANHAKKAEALRGLEAKDAKLPESRINLKERNPFAYFDFQASRSWLPSPSRLRAFAVNPSALFECFAVK